MDILMIVEKTARELDERGRIPFSAVDIQEHIQKNFNRNLDLNSINQAIETLLVSNPKQAPIRKCLYKEKNGGYSYLHACSFGAG
ncbi:hypothetical protein [Hippea jasoniae]|uniref:hypothetical protein n=1 Tax=Hippea jasoniae TaxID=944479 RepID=UPI00055431FB|nr:hypothetical protein [Hippea jasoniae]